MSRRSKIDLYGLTERAVKLYNNEKLTIKQIADVFKDEGIDISTSGVQRSIADAKEAAREISIKNEEARAILDAYRDNPGTDIAEASVKLLSSKLFSAAMDMEDFEENNPVELVKMSDKLASAQVKISAHTLKYTTGFEEAQKAVLSSLKNELKNHPDILEKLCVIVMALEPQKK